VGSQTEVRWPAKQYCEVGRQGLAWWVTKRYRKVGNRAILWGGWLSRREATCQMIL
jgi:hypothetical protein